MALLVFDSERTSEFRVTRGNPGPRRGRLVRLPLRFHFCRQRESAEEDGLWSHNHTPALLCDLGQRARPLVAVGSSSVRWKGSCYLTLCVCHEMLLTRIKGLDSTCSMDADWHIVQGLSSGTHSSNVRFRGADTLFSCLGAEGCARPIVGAPQIFAEETLARRVAAADSAPSRAGFQAQRTRCKNRAHRNLSGAGRWETKLGPLPKRAAEGLDVRRGAGAVLGLAGGCGWRRQSPGQLAGLSRMFQGAQP